ncbi:MAG: cytochrome b N-terminal domain-containing protein [Chloroflexota bacterium]|nr:cytochrome b N-terminal domain-containing protein [Chloroflexota bacterium]
MATNRVYEWVDERTGIKPALDYVMYRRLPKSANWFFTLGSASMTVFLVQAITGIFLAMGYSPSTAPVPIEVTKADGVTKVQVTSTEALESIRHLTDNVLMGDWIRGLHHWGANAMVILVVLHMLRVFFMGSYKYPRELTWFLGVFLLLMVIGFSFTGYLLPWDNRAYWATQVGINIGGSAPLLGDLVATVLRGGPTLGAATLTRFYAIHVLILPTLTGLLMGLHLFLVIKIGISGQPKYRETVTNDLFESVSPDGKKSGKAFFPYIIFKDAVVSALVVVAIVLFTIFVPFGNTNPADPQNNYDAVSGGKFEPRPEWYFLFLFQFLKIVPNIDAIGLTSKAIGGVLIPTVVIGILFFIPYIDRGAKRHPFNRPITTVVTLAILIGIVAMTVVSMVESPGDLTQATDSTGKAIPVPGGIEKPWADAKSIKPILSIAPTPTAAPAAPLPAAAQAGLTIFQAKCTMCHLKDGKGDGGIGLNLSTSPNAGTEAYIRSVIAVGSPNKKMPAPGTFTPQEVNNLVAYVLAIRAK